MLRGECRFLCWRTIGWWWWRKEAKLFKLLTMTNTICFRKIWPTKYLLFSFDEPLSSGVNTQFSKSLNNGKINSEKTKSSFDVTPAWNSNLWPLGFFTELHSSIDRFSLISTPLVHINISIVKGKFLVPLRFNEYVSFLCLQSSKTCYRPHTYYIQDTTEKPTTTI